jgi:ribosomal protein S18 acetylase RimI-like enzyme
VPPTQPLATSAPAGIRTRTSTLTSEAGQAAYLAVYNRCFPERPKTRDDLQLPVEAPFWRHGTAIFAEDPGGGLVGSVLIYPDAAGAGVTDDVFVEPSWRGKGVARYLVTAGLDRTRVHGLPRARLKVRRSNASALELYESLGYTRVDEQLLLAHAL